jgi:hypothetical protein
MEWLILIVVIVIATYMENTTSSYGSSSKKIRNDEDKSETKNKLSLLNIIKATKIYLSSLSSSLNTSAAIADAVQQKDNDKADSLSWKLTNEIQHRQREVSALLSPNSIKKSDYDHSLDWEKIAISNDREAKENPLKRKGDSYERSIGFFLERQGHLVIYNGLIRGYKDLGVDIVAISESSKEVMIVQCKNWNHYQLTYTAIEKIYHKLMAYYTTDYFDLHPSLIINSSRLSRYDASNIAWTGYTISYKG